MIQQRRGIARTGRVLDSIAASGGSPKGMGINRVAEDLFGPSLNYLSQDLLADRMHPVNDAGLTFSGVVVL